MKENEIEKLIKEREELLCEKEKEISTRLNQIEEKIKLSLRKDLSDSLTGKYLKNEYTNEYVHVTYFWPNVLRGEVISCFDECITWAKNRVIGLEGEIRVMADIMKNGWKIVSKEEYEEVKDRILKFVNNDLRGTTEI